MAKVFERAVLEIFQVDEDKGEAKRVKIIPNLVETVQEDTIRSIGQALKPLLKEGISHVAVITQYRHTLD